VGATAVTRSTDVRRGQPRPWSLRRRRASEPAPTTTTPAAASAPVSVAFDPEAGFGTPVSGAPAGTAATCLPPSEGAAVALRLTVGDGTGVEPLPEPLDVVGAGVAVGPPAAVEGTGVGEPPSATAVPAPPAASAPAQAMTVTKDRARMRNLLSFRPGRADVRAPGCCGVQPDGETTRREAVL
jgi:hypothetical protein